MLLFLMSHKKRFFGRQTRSHIIKSLLCLSFISNFILFFFQHSPKKLTIERTQLQNKQPTIRNFYLIDYCSSFNPPLKQSSRNSRWSWTLWKTWSCTWSRWWDRTNWKLSRWSLPSVWRHSTTHTATRGRWRAVKTKSGAGSWTRRRCRSNITSWPRFERFL